MKVGFVGLGNMGHAMARNLLKAGHELTVYNRTRAKAESLRRRAPGSRRRLRTRREARRSSSPCSRMIRPWRRCVFGEAGLLAGLEKGAIHISSSTISVALSERLAEAHAAGGAGLRVRARLRQAGGGARPSSSGCWPRAPKADVERCRPLLEAMGRGLSVLGERASRRTW